MLAKVHSGGSTTDKQKLIREPSSYPFYCEYCQVGSTSEKVHLSHLAGKKHKKLVRQSVESKPSSSEVVIAGPNEQEQLIVTVEEPITTQQPPQQQPQQQPQQPQQQRSIVPLPSAASESPSLEGSSAVSSRKPLDYKAALSKPTREPEKTPHHPPLEQQAPHHLQQPQQSSASVRHSNNNTQHSDKELNMQRTRVSRGNTNRNSSITVTLPPEPSSESNWPSLSEAINQRPPQRRQQPQQRSNANPPRGNNSKKDRTPKEVIVLSSDSDISDMEIIDATLVTDEDNGIPLINGNTSSAPPQNIPMMPSLVDAPEEEENQLSRKSTNRRNGPSSKDRKPITNNNTHNNNNNTHNNTVESAEVRKRDKGKEKEDRSEEGDLVVCAINFNDSSQDLYNSMPHELDSSSPPSSPSSSTSASLLLSPSQQQQQQPQQQHSQQQQQQQQRSQQPQQPQQQLPQFLSLTPPVIDSGVELPFLLGPRFVDIPPWISNAHSGEQEQQPLSLHEEILAFCEYISPTVEEVRMREDVISRISATVHSLWPEAEINVFGSCATNIYLPTSDVDLCVMGATQWNGQYSRDPLYNLQLALKRRNNPRSIQCIAHARVPIIKMVDNPSDCLVDISFDIPNGPANTHIVKKFLEEAPLVRPLAMVLKYYLQQLGLNEPYTGGIGSYTLLIMIISYLQLHKPADSAQQDDLGVLLIGFLKLYGIDFNYHRTGISIRNGGSYFNKEARDWLDVAQSHLLSAEDPGFPENDVSKCSFAIMEVRDVFKHAYLMLTAGDKVKNAPSLLCRVLLRDERMEQHRKVVRRLYRFEERPAHSSSNSLPAPAFDQRRNSNSNNSSNSNNNNNAGRRNNSGNNRNSGGGGGRRNSNNNNNNYRGGGGKEGERKRQRSNEDPSKLKTPKNQKQRR